MLFEDYIQVPKEYHFSFHNNIYSVLEHGFKQKLDVFTQKFEAAQLMENYPFLPEHLIPKFPFIDYPPFKNEILERQQDVKLLEKHLPLDKLENATALELGGWNGWLPNILGKNKIQVVSVGIFADKNNGLGCREFYQNCKWLSVQADIEDVAIYKRKFDLIVFEHNLNFQNNPLHLLDKYESILNPGGLLVILGVGVMSNTCKKEEEIKQFRNTFEKKYHFSIDFYKSKGIFDTQFYQTLLGRNYRFFPYRFSLKNQFLKKIKGNKKGIFIYQKTG